MKTTIQKIINDKDAYTLLNYTDGRGFPVCKALLKPRCVEDSRLFYFSTNTSSHKVAAYEKYHNGSIYFFNPKTFVGISLNGQVEVLKDLDIKTKLWMDGDEQFYPLGINDPDYCVLKFTITHGRAYLSNRNEDFTL